MDIKDTLYIDNSFYYLNDPSDINFQFHYVLGLAFNKEEKEALIKDASNVLDSYGIYWFNPDRSDDAFFDDDPVNSPRQDIVFSNLGNRLTSYVIDIFDVLIKHNVTIFKSSDHRSFMEYDGLGLESIITLYNDNVHSLINSYITYGMDENENYSFLDFIYNDRNVLHILEEKGLLSQSFKEKESDILLHVLLDFFNNFLNLYLKLLAKKSKSNLFKIVNEIKIKYYPLVIYDKYAKVRNAANEIAEAIINLKYKK